MSVLDVIGNTPLVEIRKFHSNHGVRLLAKLEGHNPGGSVKDRIAAHMILEAEKRGALKPGKVILEPTSGNTGIGLAMVGAAKGYRVKLTMPACVSMERRRVLEALGADLILTPSELATDGAILKAREIYSEDQDTYFMPDQFRNQDNILAHYYGTGREILEQTGGDICAFVAGMGTTGTLMGVARRLKEYNESIVIAGAEPTEGHTIQGLKNMKESIVPEIFNPDVLDRRIIVNDEPAFDMTRRLATEEGMFVGMSSGAALHAALQLINGMTNGTVVVLFPDRGDRYLSTNLFKSICGKCPP